MPKAFNGNLFISIPFLVSSAYTMLAGRCIDERPTKCIAAEIIKTSGNLDVLVREMRSWVYRELLPAACFFSKGARTLIFVRHDSMRDPMFLFACETKYDESLAFPSRLRPAVRDTVASLATGELHPPRQAFMVKVDRETLCIPYRLYYTPEVMRRELGNAQGVIKLILACLGTRHYDGYLRQECLKELLASDEAWLTPYFLQLAGEYVVEIAEDVAEGIGKRDAAALAAFALENPGYLATLERRVTSYWSYYHRRTYPERNRYPGTKVLAVLHRAASDYLYQDPV
jgi:hypothetical protein